MFICKCAGFAQNRGERKMSRLIAFVAAILFVGTACAEPVSKSMTRTRTRTITIHVVPHHVVPHVVVPGRHRSVVPHHVVPQIVVPRRYYVPQRRYYVPVPRYYVPRYYVVPPVQPAQPHHHRQMLDRVRDRHHGKAV